MQYSNTMYEFSYLPEISDIIVYSSDKTYSFKGHKFALVKIDEWKDKVLTTKEFITPFNRSQLLVILSFIYNNTIKNGQISELDTLNLISKIINIKFFATLTSNLWHDLFDCMIGVIDSKIFSKIVDNVSIYKLLLQRDSFLEHLLKLSKETLRCIPSSFIFTLINNVGCCSDVGISVISLSSIIAKWGCANGDKDEVVAVLQAANKEIPNILHKVPVKVLNECISLFTIGPILEVIITLKLKGKGGEFQYAKEATDALYTNGYSDWLQLLNYMKAKYRARDGK